MMFFSLFSDPTEALERENDALNSSQTSQGDSSNALEDKTMLVSFSCIHPLIFYLMHIALGQNIHFALATQQS